MTTSSPRGKATVATPLQSDPVKQAEVFRRRYLEAWQKIPIEGSILTPEAWDRERDLSKICDAATRSGKLPRHLPEWVYEGLREQILFSLRNWDTLRIYSENHKLAEQARKRIREAWMTLHRRKDRRVSASPDKLWYFYSLEQGRVKSVIEVLRPAVTQNRGIPRLKLRQVAIGWDLTEDDVKNIWANRKKTRPLAKELLALRFNISVERLNHILAKRRKTFVSQDYKMPALGGSMAEPLLPLGLLVSLATPDGYENR